MTDLRATLAAAVALLGSHAQAAQSPYQQYFSVSCSKGQTCVIAFMQIPAGGRIELSHASCQIRGEPDPKALTAKAAIKYVQVWMVDSDLTIEVAATLAPVVLLAPQENEPAIWALNQPVKLYGYGTQQFRIATAVGDVNTAITFMGCHVSGTLYQ